MTFREWQQLSPGEAAREVHQRVRTRLSPSQQRAALAWVPAEPALADAFRAARRSGPLGGVPYFLKDLFDVAGLDTFAGSTFLPEVRPRPQEDSAIVRTLRSAGAVFAGKTHLHEFAYGITGENPHYGDCEHPGFPGRTTGGSSSGSAAAVAAGVVPLAIGTDTGGSIRVPAAFGGLYGFRLTPNDPLIADAFPLAPSFDTAGWFTANAPDLLATLHALVGSTAPTPALRGCYLEPAGLDPEVATACRAAAERFAPAADELVRDTLLHGFAHCLDTYNDIVAAEAWQVHAPWAERFRERYDPAVWARLERGATMERAVYERAQVDVAATRLLWAKYFLAYDFLVMPAAPFPALTKSECTAENRQRLLTLTAPASVAGLPVLTVPVTLSSGLTSGLQIIAYHPRSAAFHWVLEQ